MHRTLMHACQGVRPLWAAPDDTHLIIRHTAPVDWATEFPTARQCVTIPTEAPATGLPVRWAMIGNPVTNLPPKEGRGRGKRVPAPPEKWKAWCERHLTDALNLHSIDATRLSTARGRKPDMRTTHQRVMFTGEGTVRNQDELARIMIEGTGPGKAYGCGLLLVEAIA